MAGSVVGDRVGVHAALVSDVSIAAVPLQLAQSPSAWCVQSSSSLYGVDNTPLKVQLMSFDVR